MAVFNPQIPWDIGFQLSFAATLGLVLYAGLLTQAFQRLVPARLSPEAARRLSHLVGEYFLFTLAAQVVTLPVTLYHFQRLAIVALLANPLVLPAQSAVMILGGLAVLLGLAWLPAGRLAAALAWPFAAYTVRAVELLARLPGGNLALAPVGLLVVALGYALLFATTWAAVRRPTWIAALKPAGLLVLAAVAALTIWVWRSALAAPDGRLHLVLLDVGSGDAVLVQTPGGRSLLVDGGPSARALSDALGRRLPPGRRQLDWLVVAATGEEQLGALPDTLERFPPHNVLWAGPPSGSAPARALQKLFIGSGITPLPAQTGQALDLGSGARLRVLAAGKRGAVLLLEWEGFHALLPIGQDFDTLEALQADPLLVPVEALLLAEGGQGPLNPPEWIAKLQPQVVLLSVGAGNWQGRPDLQALEAVSGYTLLRTDRNGWIHLSTDGQQMWVEVERK
jgi:competence protein ComEC